MEQMVIFGENLGRLFVGMGTWIQDGYGGHRLTCELFFKVLHRYLIVYL